MDYPSLIAALPAETVTALATTPQGLTLASQVEVATKPTKDTGTDRVIWLTPPDVEIGPALLGGRVYTYKFMCCMHKSGGTDAELEIWAEQIRAHFDGNQRPANIDGFLSASVGDILLKASRNGQDVEAVVEVAFTGIKSGAVLATEAATVMKQQVRATPVTSLVTCSTAIPYDATIPQNTEGDEVITVTITPNSTSNSLLIEFDCWGEIATGTAEVIVALFKDSDADAIHATAQLASLGRAAQLSLRHTMAVGSVSAQTFKIRIGSSNGNSFYVNGDSSAVVFFNGASAATLTVSEIEP